jgi:predicted Fe-Mo cluster-binding NifX family protein
LILEALSVGRRLKMRLAVASQGVDGLDDIVSNVFGRSPAFTIVDIEDGVVKQVRAKQNESADSYHGAGPLTCMRLSKLDVNVVIAASFGPTVSDILKEARIETFTMMPRTKVKNAIEQYVRKKFSVSLRIPEALG